MRAGDDVTICIPTYNQSNYLIASIESALNQTGFEAQVIVSDDCSTDETEELLAQLQMKSKRLAVIRQPQNLGISGNVNYLLQSVKTKYVLRLDSDDLLLPHYLQTLVPLLEQESQAGYAHAAVREIDWQGRELRIRRLMRRSGYQGAEDALRSQAAGYRVAANILLFRTEALQSVNFITPNLNFAEDWDLVVRLADAGWGNVYSSDVLACYRVWSNELRFKRKVQEISGCIHVHEKSLRPAFEKRKWDQKTLRRHRQELALNQALSVDSPILSAQEREELCELLRHLGRSTRLEILLLMINFGFGSSLRMTNSLKTRLKDSIKSIIRRTPSSS